MGKSFFNRINWPGVGMVLSLSVVLVFFQNCGKAGMEGDDLSSLVAESPDVKKFKAAPFPFDININQIAYMTCPAANETRVRSNEDVESPFFTIRVGAFDNTSLATRFPAAFGATSVDPDKSGRLRAGVGLSAAFLSYIRTNFSARLANAKPEDEKRLIRDALANSNYKFGVTGALLYRNRSTPKGFTPDSQHFAKPAFPDLTSLVVANQLVDAPDLGSWGKQKVGIITGVEVQSRSMVMSANFGRDVSEAEFFRNEMGDMEFAVGFSKEDVATDSFEMASPTGNNADSIYGKVYRFPPLTSTWKGRVDRVVEGGSVVTKSPIASFRSEFLDGIEEVEILQKGAVTPTGSQQQQKWSCFSLMIVRDMDRRDPIGWKVFDPGEYEDPLAARNCKLWGPTATACETKLKFYDYQANSTSAIIPSAKVACPNQEVGTSTRYGSINYNLDGGMNRMRLEIARRFLPAEFWDINTHPEYMCAVPRRTTEGLGSCYGSKTDWNGSENILYSQTGFELGAQVSCGTSINGTTNKKCPAFVSVCYRTN